MQVETAGAAFGCRFSTSEEYEADLIAERRGAGAYGAPRRRRAGLWTAAAFALLGAILAMF